MHPPRHRPGAIIAAATALTSCILLAACTTPDTSTSASTSPTLTRSSSPPTVTPDPSSPNPSQQAEDAAVLAAYNGFWAAKVAMYAHPAGGDASTLTKYAIDRALTDTRATALIYQRNGIVRRGAPTRSPQITAAPVGDPLTAVITDCLDSTHWQPVYKETGKSAAAPGQPKRVVVTSNVQLYRGRWVVRASVAHRDLPC